MRDIAQSAGLSLAGLYHHFPGKDELLFRIEVDAYRRLVEPVRELPPAMPPAEKVRRIVHNHVLFFAGQITEMKVLSHELTALGGERGRRITGMQRDYFALCHGAVSDLLRRTGRRTRRARVATMCLFGMMNWIYTWYDPERDGDPEDLARRMTQVLMHGLVSVSDSSQPKHRRRQRTTTKAR
jgi:TetR/AcrR family transcriptional regulator